MKKQTTIHTAKNDPALAAAMASLGMPRKSWMVTSGDLFWTGRGWSYDEEQGILYHDESEAKLVAKRTGGKVE